MYESFFGFSEKPFNLTPDPKFLFLSARHTEAFAHLDFGHRERGGFVVITGEVGTGKTTLARYFLSRLGDTTSTAVILYPALTADELLRSILDDLHVKDAAGSLKDLVDALHRFLLESRAAGRNVVLLIDEAQDLSTAVLEQIRLLSNLETDTEKLIQIVLMGQSELQEMLGRRELRQLAQRVTARYHLLPLNRAETGEYIRHRLTVVGGEGKVTFTPGAIAAVHAVSGGIPRVINLVCDRSLLAGYVHGTRMVHAGMVRSAAEEVRGEIPSSPRRRLVGWGAAAAGLALVAVTTFLWARGSAPRETPRPAVAPVSSPTPPSSPSPEPPPTADLEPVLLALDHDASRRGALAEVQALWRAPSLQTTALRTHIEQVRRLDLPVVLEMFHPARRDTCFVALLGLDAETAWVANGTGVPFRVALPQLDQLWTRQALFLWEDSDSISGGPPSQASAWALEALGKLGYEDANRDPRGALTRFQRDTELVPDGLLGSRTLMALYGTKDRPRPHLVRKPS